MIIIIFKRSTEMDFSSRRLQHRTKVAEWKEKVNVEEIESSMATIHNTYVIIILHTILREER
jgi:hypothetical protein